MKNNTLWTLIIFQKRLVLLFILHSLTLGLLNPTPIFSQDDTLSKKRYQWIVPTACIGYGFLGTFVKPIKVWHESLQESIQTFDTDGPHYEDFTQYAPALAVYALDLTRIQAQSKPLAQTWKLGMSFAIMGATVNSLKYTTKIQRPDKSSFNSFPSGHTATSFMTAEFLNQEFKNHSPWIGFAGYVVASYSGFMRMYHNRHYLPDVMAGAGIGVLSTKLAYWIYPKIAKQWHARRGNKEHRSYQVLPYYSSQQFGLLISFH